MRPFNLQEALAGKPVITRDGRKVTEIYYFKTADKTLYPITAVINGESIIYRKDGNYWSNGRESDYDIFMAPESIDVWVNVWKNIDGFYDFGIHKSEESSNEAKAEENDIWTFIKTRKITIEL